MRVYLAGSITGYNYDEVNDWRKHTKNVFNNEGIDAYSPMRGKVYLSKEDMIQNSYSNHTMSSIDGINIRDFNDCKNADALLVNFLGATKVSIGTVMEVAWARAFQIPIVMVMEEGNIHEHCMLTYNVIREKTLENGISAIIQILKS